MASTTLSGNDTLTINNYTFADFGTDDVCTLTFPNEISNVRTGKNGNSIYGLNETGRQCELKLRVLRGSADDKFLQALINTQLNNFSGFVLMQGQFVKVLGDGSGNLTYDTYIVSGGVFTKQVEGKMNTAGDEQQSISEFMIKFSNSPRLLT